jgi:hypothetical protein
MRDSIYMYCYTNEVCARCPTATAPLISRPCDALITCCRLRWHSQNTTVGDHHPCPLEWMIGGGVARGSFGGVVGFDHYYSEQPHSTCPC